MTTFLLADDHPVVRTGLKALLEAHRLNWSVCTEAADGPGAIAAAMAAKPDIAVVAYMLPKLSGIEVAARILAGRPKTQVLIYSNYSHAIVVRDAIRAGAHGYVLKASPKERLLEAASALAIGRSYYDPALSESVAAAMAHKGGEILSARQRSILRLIAEGQRNRQMANILNISLKTVESHRATVMRKLSITTSAGLVRYAIRNGIAEP